MSVCKSMGLYTIGVCLQIVMAPCLYIDPCMLCVCIIICVLIVFKTYSEDDEPDTRGRQGRQQTGGDTYTLEISFPAVKYVLLYFKTNMLYIALLLA